MKIKILVVIVLILVVVVAIKHADVMASGQRGLHTEWNKDHIIDGNVECNQHQHLQHVIENRVAWPAGPVIGQIIYRTDLHAAYIWDGTQWLLFARTTSYWSCPGLAFMPEDSTKEALYEGGIYSSQEVAGTSWLFAKVYLPHGAVVTGAVVYGDDNTQTWRLRRVDHVGAVAELATAVINTEDVTINNATVDNSLYGYYFEVLAYPWDHVIYGGRVTYIL